MTAKNDLDQAIGAWLGGEAAVTLPPEPLERILATTRTLRPRPALTARIGSGWVGAVSTSGPWGGLASLRPVMVVGLVALLAVALVGAVLVVGGRLDAPRTPPRTYVNELTSARDLSLPMAYPALVPLLDGRVLVIGDDGNGGGTTTRALVYDPATGVSEPTGPLASSEWWVESAVPLRDGRVLVFGSADQGNAGTQVFDPNTLRFAPVGPMITPRSWAAVAVLPDGHVLIAGGYPSGQDAATSSAELFDPDALTFSPTGSMGTSRSMPSTAILPDGRVFISPGESRTTVEIYDPRSEMFSAAGTTSSYGFGRAIALPDGRVVVIGGSSLGDRGVAAVWDPTSLTFSPERELPGWATSATLLDDGRILLVGGEPENWSGIYDPTTGVTTSIQSTRAWHPRATRLADGRVLIVGGLTDGDLRPPGGTSAPGVSTVQIFQ
jgi:hypothetical protein